MRAPLLLLTLMACATTPSSPTAAATKPTKDAAPPLVPHVLDTDDKVVAAIAEFYTKHEVMVPMRDGVRLHTTLYIPKDQRQQWPFMMMRTPYGVAPYGVENLPDASSHRALARFAPSPTMVQHGYIWVHQDVRGRMMSEGDFVDVRPLHQRPLKKGEFDEASDAWDTVDWLIKHVDGNNGRFGVWGISYPGRYAAEAAVDAHPAVKAISPQAPVTDWFRGDDFHHNGALFLADAFSFYANFGRPRPKPTTTMKWDFDADIDDVYAYFLALGPVRNANEKYLKGEIPFWNDLMAHENRDAFWEARDPRPHFKDIKPAVLVTGGFYDAEDLWGTLATYEAMNRQSKNNRVTLAMGPWFHGGWARTDGDAFGDLRFHQKTSVHYRDNIEAPFFASHLKGDGTFRPAEAEVFLTGLNQWASFPTWPPHSSAGKTSKPTSSGQLTDQDGRIFLVGDSALGATPGPARGVSFLADPNHPVPFMGGTPTDIDKTYMVADQRFASRRPDVLTFTSPVLDDDLVVAGPIEIDLLLETTGTDLDVVVKLIDVQPEGTTNPSDATGGTLQSGAALMVRGEILRGRFRNDPANPSAFVPNTKERVRFTLPDVCHAFRRQHRLQVQVQASWFPLVDRNPQTFVPIRTAVDADFVPQTHTVHTGDGGSFLRLPLIDHPGVH